MSFALFEDCLHPTQKNSYLFSDVHSEIIAYHTHEILPALEKINQLRQQGLYLAGYLAYEAANSFYPQLKLPHDPTLPMLHFVAYHWMQQFTSQDLPQLIPDLINQEAKTDHQFDYLELADDFKSYQGKFAAVQQQLVLGNTYQLNLTLPLRLHSNTDNLAALYSALSRSHPVAYASYLPFAPQSIISISPELFFKKSAATIEVRPMKGTMPRGNTPQEDEKLSDLLAKDEKNRAENLIIVDLLRNDLAKFCNVGSIQVPQLFHIEKYASLFQMTTTICANLDPENSLTTILQGLFPCGSITGAPKLSTLQLIQKIENYSRGVYSGAIGYILPNNEMQFSVAIRTLSTAAQQPQELTLGVGGGITVQATAKEEWQEILTKLKFVRKFYQPQFNLIESFLVANGRIQNLTQHVERLTNSAQALIFACDATEINQALLAYVAEHCQNQLRYKLRLELNYRGEFKIEDALIGANPEFLKVALAPYQLDSRHGLFRHKTDSQLTRGKYTQIDNTAKPQGIDELIFINQDGIITESRYHNVIIDYQGELITTPAENGLLAGIFRANLIREGKLKERVITPEMLSHACAIFLCNDVRCMLPAKLQRLEPNLCS